MEKVDAKVFDSDELSAVASNLLVVTAEAHDQRAGAVGEVLAMVRNVLKMDVVFVAEFVDGHRVFRHVDASADRPVIAVGQSDPLEKSWCQRVVDGRLPQLIPNVADLPEKEQLPALPFEIGTHLSTPVVLNDGRVYGTLCCFSFSPSKHIQQNDLTNLQAVAEVLSTHLTGPPTENAKT